MKIRFRVKNDKTAVEKVEAPSSSPSRGAWRGHRASPSSVRVFLNLTEFEQWMWGRTLGEVEEALMKRQRRRLEELHRERSFNAMVDRESARRVTSPDHLHRQVTLEYALGDQSTMEIGVHRANSAVIAAGQNPITGDMVIASAVCAPEDVFVWELGRDLAVGRLLRGIGQSMIDLSTTGERWP